MAKHGFFYFKLTDSGNLLGEFMSSGCNGFSTESGNRYEKSLSKHGFEGEFLTHCDWGEGLHEYDLKIEKEKEYYILTWSRKEKKEIMSAGKGGIVDGMLIGHYFNGDISYDQYLK